VVKRKGFDVLLAALAPLTQMSWQLTIAGDLSRDAQAVAQLHLDVQRFGLAKRVHILGAVDSARLQALYSDADVFVLASRFEGYGMAYAEALANGLPVIGTSAGAIPDTVPSAAGLLAEPGDIDSLTHALRQIMQEPDLRQRLAQGALAAAALQPSWADCAASFEQVVARTCALKQF
jgi:glycosyltransferase involved in cell wall biosynthesis